MRLPEAFELAPEADPETLLAAALERAELEDAAREEAAVGIEPDAGATAEHPRPRRWR